MPTARGLGCYRLGTIKMESAAAASYTVRPRQQHSRNLPSVTPAHVQAMLASLEKRGVSPHVRQRAYIVLHRAFAQAVLWGMAARNACDGAARPRLLRKVMRVLAPDQVAMLLDTARGTRLEALYVLAVTTGLRQGELLGLHWEDIDLVGATLRVCRALQQVGNRIWLDEPKTPRARRTVNLLAFTVAALKAHRERMLAEGHPHGFVFCNTLGGPIWKSNLIRQTFKPLLRQANLPLIRFHDLRHTAATLLLGQGVHPKIVQEQLGSLADLSDARYLQSCAPYHGTRSRWEDRFAADWSA